MSKGMTSLVTDLTVYVEIFFCPHVKKGKIKMTKNRNNDSLPKKCLNSSTVDVTRSHTDIIL